MTRMPSRGVYSVTGPGCVRGWEALHKKFGRLPWSELFQPAIYYARNGFPLTEIVQAFWQQEEKALTGDANTTRVFLIGGAAPKVGDIFRNPEYAHALELIAREGRRRSTQAPWPGRSSRAPTDSAA